MVQSVMVRVAAPGLYKPPPREPLAELPLIVQSESVAVPSFFRPPPVLGGVAADRAAGERQRTKVVQAAAVVGGIAADDAVE